VTEFMWFKAEITGGLS